MSKNICLIIPDRPYLINQKALPSLAPLYLAHTLKERGYETEVLDFADGYTFHEADIYGISITTPDFDRSFKILEWLKKKGAKHVIGGGTHANIAPEECLQAGFDGVSIGDGELTIERLIKSKGKIISAWGNNINKFYPDRTIIDLWDYEFYVSGIRATSIMTSRGCWWATKTGGCAFCCRCDNGKIRYNNIQHVKKELKDIHELGFEAVLLYDDCWFCYPKRDIEIVKSLKALGFTWRCFSRVDVILKNKKIIEKAAKNGLAEVLLGIESVSNDILKIINKGCTKDQISEAINFLSDLGVHVKTTFIVGNPSESENSLTELKEFLYEHIPKIHDIDFSILQIYPQCKIWRDPNKFDLQWEKSKTAYKSKPDIYNDISPISTSHLSFAELLIWRNELEKEFKPQKFIR